MIIGDSVILSGGGGRKTYSIVPAYDEWQHNTWVTLRVDIDAEGNLSIRQSSGGGTTTGLRICYPQGSDTTITKIPDIPTRAGTYTLPITAVWSGDSNNHTLTYTVVESGGGSRFATIVVTAPTGSTVTMSHGGKTTIGAEVSGTWTFKAREYGAYTLTATKYGETATKTVVVDAATQYTVSLAYGTPLADIAVGSIVKLNVGGVAKDFIVVHQGNPNSSIYSTTYNDGTILLMKDIYENMAWHSSDRNDYANCTLNAYLYTDFLALFDANIQLAIKNVKVPYRPSSGTSQTCNTGENGQSVKIFLLSGAEIGFTNSDSSYLPTNEGAKLSYFESGTGTSANNKRIAKLNGSASTWWLRSPYIGSTGSAVAVGYNGTLHTYGCSQPYISGARPAFVLPNTMLVDDNGMITEAGDTAPEDGPTPSQSHTITISGHESVAYWTQYGIDAYVVHGGINHTDNFSVPAGDAITLKVTYMNDSTQFFKIILNGVEVGSVVSNTRSYTFTPASDVDVVISVDMNGGYSAILTLTATGGV